MFTNTPFESAAKTMKANAEKFNPAAAQEAFKPVMEQLKAWGDLAQKQAQVAQASIAETVESFKSVKEPQGAFEALKASAENGIAIATKNLQDVTALGVAQFNTSIDAIEKAHPAPEVFANVGQSLKTAASSMEDALESALKKGSAAVASVSATAKKSRAS
ncbi:MAG: hypothetical protein ABIQ90_08985 [Polaromonas sp.]